MKKIVAALIGAAAVFLTACATTSLEGGGISLHEAIEKSAEKICADLPKGCRVAIVAWESPSPGLSDYVMEELTGALVDRGMELADRQNLEYVYRELNFQMSGAVSDETAQSVGKFLGAEMVITGQLTALGGPYRYRASAVHVENATRNSVSRFDAKGDAALQRMVAALANQKTAVKTASYGEGAKPALPGTAGAFLDRGIMFASRGDYTMAIEDFTEAIKLNANLSSAYLLRGRAYFASVVRVYSAGENFSSVVGSRASYKLDAAQQQVYEKAIEDYSQAIRLDPNNAVSYRERGNAYYHKEENDKSIADYNQAIRLDPNDAEAYTLRGGAYEDKGDYTRARADYTKALQIDPNHKSARDYLNELGDRGR